MNISLFVVFLATFVPPTVAQEPCQRHQCRENSKCSDINFEFIRCREPGSDKCRSLEETWDVGCFQYTCVIENGMIQAKVTGRGCRDFKTDKCRRLGETWKDGCAEFGCSYNGTHVLTDLVSGSCRDPSSKRCYAVGEQWERGCATFQCFRNGNVWESKPVKNKCNFGGKCRNDKETWPVSSNPAYDCYRFECTVKKNLSYSIRFKTHMNKKLIPGVYDICEKQKKVQK